ncbi:MAG: hypothetical protein K2V38_18045, partial [Gemmataceae bacterium]|nr:hypothetical protein [Gemmataceae bacterium]
MGESHGEGPASHPDPESCVDGRKAGGEALTGAHAGQPSSCEIRSSGVPTPLRNAEGNTDSGVIGEPGSDPTQSETLSTKDKKARFTALLHHVTADELTRSFYALKSQAAPGIDGVTWQQYEVGLDDRIADLLRRVQAGTYRATPVKRAFIPKPDGTQRPLGIAALEDKVVQHAVVTVLNAIYEIDFLGFSYGFRPGRSAHDALEALTVGLLGKKVNWILDADIRGFFDTIGHEWLVKFIEHRIADRRIVRLIQKWLRAGVSENGQWSPTNVGTPQGAVASPLLANVYLHYVFDLWVHQWRQRNAKGDVVVVRYADDFVLGFQQRHEAERFLADLKERLGKFGLALHPD